jgi:hypothetical protein
MWKHRLSPRSESTSGSDSTNLHLSELGFLGRSRKKHSVPSSSSGELLDSLVINPVLLLFLAPQYQINVPPGLSIGNLRPEHDGF